MTDAPADSEVADDQAGLPAAPSRSDLALARYRGRMRRARLVYAAVLTVIVAIVVAGVAVTWSNGEAAHVTLHTVAAAPPDLPLTTPSAQLDVAWRTSDRTATGDPQWRGTIVTWSAHTVRGRNARTGATTWSYTRTDRTVCGAVQLDGTTAAVYDDGGNCDEVTGLDSATGRRTWTRTLDEDGKPVNGRTTYEAFTGNAEPTLIVRSAQTVYAIDPGSGEDRWSWFRYGCTIRGMVLGTSGALMSLGCSSRVHCASLRFCRPGTQLVLRDGSAGYDTDHHPKNPDRIIWDLSGNSDLPVAADSLLAALNPTTHALDVVAAKNGKPAGQVALSPAPTATAPISAVATDPAEIVTIGARTYAVDGTSVTWTAATPAAPTVVSPGGADVPELDTARITTVVPGAVESRSGTTGRVTRRFPVPHLPGGTALPLGTGYLVSSRAATVALR